jgi:5-methyltetrahydropteroyltriglutamate--homocysteine methyltransferase
MLRSTDRILVSHAGRLSSDNEKFEEVEQRKSRGEEFSDDVYVPLLENAIREVIERQVRTGVDVLSDGELGRRRTWAYYRKRMGGLIYRECKPGEYGSTIFDTRERQRFKKYYDEADRARYAQGAPSRKDMRMVAVDKLAAKDTTELEVELDRFRRILTDLNLGDRDAFFPVISPGWLDHFIFNEYYKTDDEFIFGLAEMMRPEYEKIVEKGFIVQVDAPDLPDAWATLVPNITIEDYRKRSRVRVEALNYALRNIPEDMVRYHLCWGSWNGPHVDDIPFKDVVDLMLEVKAQAYSFEAGNVRHEHEWKIWRDVKLPAGKILIPGIVSHRTTTVEHPEVVADRILNFANLVGRENVIAGTDCGMGGGRIPHEIGWAKLETMVEGAELASKELWSSAAA